MPKKIGPKRAECALGYRLLPLKPPQSYAELFLVVMSGCS
jgi:hypothetical protein